MLILGIETSCDETAMAVLSAESSKEPSDIKILSNIISSQVKIHAPYGGVYPALAAREHAKNIDKVFKLALKEAGLKNVEEIDLIAVTHGPGLAVALIMGVTFAKTLAWKYKKPVIGVNHLEGHIYSNWLPSPELRNPVSYLETGFLSNLPSIFPALNLIVSGGHTELMLMNPIRGREGSQRASASYGMKDHGQYKIIGETVDDAAGEAFDKIARLLGLGYPGGPLISAEAEKYKVRPLSDQGRTLINLPRPMINSKDFNFSFSGLKTAVLYLIRNLETTSRFNLDVVRPEIAHEVQQAMVDVLVAKTVKAAEKYKPKSILLSGGVSANSQLRLGLNKAAEKMGIKYFQPELKYTGDNAAMIALAGYFNYANKKTSFKEAWKRIKLDANLRI